jgi:hypothetical protein
VLLAISPSQLVGLEGMMDWGFEVSKRILLDSGYSKSVSWRITSRRAERQLEEEFRAPLSKGYL